MQTLWCCLGAVWTLPFTSIGSICFASCVDWARWLPVSVEKPAWWFCIHNIRVCEKAIWLKIMCVSDKPVVNGTETTQDNAYVLLEEECTHLVAVLQELPYCWRFSSAPDSLCDIHKSSAGEHLKRERIQHSVHDETKWPAWRELDEARMGEKTFWSGSLKKLQLL